MPPAIPPKPPVPPPERGDCDTCKGSGVIFGHGGKPQTCPSCKGTGKK